MPVPLSPRPPQGDAAIARRPGFAGFALAPAAPQIAKLLGKDTAIVTAMNGVPYWNFYGHGGPHDGAKLKSVDPDGKLWDTLAPQRAIGCIVYPAANIIAPGVIETAMTESTRNDPERLGRFMARIPAGRLGRPEEIAGPAVFLASDLASYVNGITLPVDGDRQAV